MPPNCLALDFTKERKPSCVRRLQPKAEIPSIHININGNALSSTSRHNILAEVSQDAGSVSLKHSLSDCSGSSAESEGDKEALPLSDVLQNLNHKYPKLDLPQYMALFEKEKIVYAETILQFDQDYLAQLWIAEGAIYPLMLGVRKTLGRREKERKQVRLYQRDPSEEV